MSTPEKYFYSKFQHMQRVEQDLWVNCTTKSSRVFKIKPNRGNCCDGTEYYIDKHDYPPKVYIHELRRSVIHWTLQTVPEKNHKSKSFDIYIDYGNYPLVFIENGKMITNLSHSQHLMMGFADSCVLSPVIPEHIESMACIRILYGEHMCFQEKLNGTFITNIRTWEDVWKLQG